MISESLLEQERCDVRACPARWVWRLLVHGQDLQFCAHHKFVRPVLDEFEVLERREVLDAPDRASGGSLAMPPASGGGGLATA